MDGTPLISAATAGNVDALRMLINNGEEAGISATITAVYCSGARPSTGVSRKGVVVGYHSFESFLARPLFPTKLLEIERHV